jgi:GNAT superfamily N-acetyltransferase
VKRADGDPWQPIFWKNPFNWLWSKLQNWHLHWRFRHNPAPGQKFETVLDKQGRTYWLKQDGELLMVWRLFYCGEEVGNANAVWLDDEDRVEIGNLEIDTDHQGQGLGALLLLRIEAWGHQLGAGSLTGRIVAKDFQAFPGLLAWYYGHGFKVQRIEAEPQKYGTHDVASIRKALS